MKIAYSIIYALGCVGWVLMWRKVVGTGWVKRDPALFAPYVGAIFVLAANAVLVFFAQSIDYATELIVYSYVENNAVAISNMSLVVVIFVFFHYNTSTECFKGQSAQQFLRLLLCAFMLSVAGCLPLVWMPREIGWLTALRHIKTIPFTYSIFLLLTAVLVFFLEVNKAVSLSSRWDKDDVCS